MKPCLYIQETPELVEQLRLERADMNPRKNELLALVRGAVKNSQVKDKDHASHAR